jgi:hypothetical protein
MTMREPILTFEGKIFWLVLIPVAAMGYGFYWFAVAFPTIVETLGAIGLIWCGIVTVALVFNWLKQPW